MWVKLVILFTMIRVIYSLRLILVIWVMIDAVILVTIEVVYMNYD